MEQPTPDMVELDARDREVLQVLYDEPVPGGANPYLIRQRTGLNKGDVNTVLNRLARQGLVRQVTTGLYELTDRGTQEIETHER